MATNSISMQGSIPRRARRAPLTWAYIWLVLFMVIYFARPEDWIPGLAVIPLAKIAGVLAVIAFVFASIGKTHQRLPLEVIYLVLLFGQLCLTVLFSPVWRGGAFWAVLDFSKVVLIGIVMVLATRTAKHFRHLLFVQTASVAIVAVVSVWKGSSLGGRLEGVLNGIYSNPNDLALSIVVNLPLCLVLLFRSRSRVWKVVWLAIMLTMIYAVFLTSSRGGLLSLIVVTAAILWEFAVKGRHRYLLALVAAAGIIFSLYASNGVMNRFSSEDKSAAASSQERQELLIKSLEVTAQHPLFGIGPGNFPIISGKWRVTHNSYTQLSSEGGLPALILYLLILWCGFVNVRSIERMVRNKGEVSILARGIRVGLLGFAVGSFFASVAYHFFAYFLVFYSTILHQITRRESLVVLSREAADSIARADQNTQAAIPQHDATCDQRTEIGTTY